MHLLPIASRCVLGLVILLSLGGSAWAQRGGGFIEQEADSDPLLEFPGIVDTHTLKAGELVADVPFFNLEYGITSNLSVGSNLIVDLASVSGSPFGHVQFRYRFYQHGPFKTVLDLMLMGGAVQETEEMAGASLGVGLLSVNTSYRLDAVAQVTIGLRAGRALTAASNSEAPEGYQEETSLTLLAVSLAYERRLASWLHVQMAGLVVPVLVGELDSSVAAASVDVGSSIPLGSRTLLRLLLNANAGKWLFSAGALTSANTRFAQPWLGIARKWK